jgi:sugar phosphate isomerase/epimerase
MSAALFVDKSAFFASQKLYGIQLWSVREEAMKDLPGTLAFLAQTGFNNIELFGYNNGNYFGHSPAEVRSFLDANNVQSKSAHYSLADFLSKGDEDDLKKTIETAKIIGHEYVTVPFLEGSVRKRLEDFKTLSDKLNKAGEACKNAGLKFAYHNHNFEFQQFGFEQTEQGHTTGYEVMLANTDPSLVAFEMDIYWVVYAGKDPVKLFKENPGRFPMWHIKDMWKKPKTESCEVGKGIIPFKEYFKYKTETGFKYFFVEQEAFTAAPPMQAAVSNFKYVKENFTNLI